MSMDGIDALVIVALLREKTVGVELSAAMQERNYCDYAAGLSFVTGGASRRSAYRT